MLQGAITFVGVVCVYVCMCDCAYVRVFSCVYVCVFLWVLCVCARPRFLRVSSCLKSLLGHVCACVWVSVCVYARACVHMCVRAFTQNV